MLYLFTVFHANLGFSAIPREHASWIIDRCYWPVIDLAERHQEVRFGLEFPGETLEAIAAEDPLLLETLSRLWASGRCDIVGSGLVQSVLPLVPAAVNRDNLQLGQETFARLLGRRPAICYANEQSWSRGTLDMYREAGFRGLILDWENAATVANLPDDTRYRPQAARCGSGASIPVIWNSSVAFQKFQRYLHGETSLDDYMTYLGSHCGAGDRSFCLYGNDWEIIDYRPGQPIPLDGSTPRPELARLESLIEVIGQDSRLAWATPTSLLDQFPAAESYELTSAACPVPAKKQPKYNTTRWAVCGRDNSRINAECHALHRTLITAEALARHLPGQPCIEHLGLLHRETVSLWASDYRTKVTDEKYRVFHRRLGHAVALATEVLSALGSIAAPDGGPFLFNPSNEEWKNEPVLLQLRMPPGAFYNNELGLAVDGAAVVTQWETAERYRDGSLRSGRIVCCPHLAPWALSPLTVIVDGTDAAPSGAAVLKEGIETSQVALQLSTLRGGSIRSLRFPGLMAHEPVVTIPHGTFRSIDLSPDWYSGGVIIIDENGNKITDLEPCGLQLPTRPERYPVRLPMVCEVDAGAGIIQKRYDIYRDVARVDIHYRFCFRDLRPRSFRVAICTLHPTAFAVDALRYSTVNGGVEPEQFTLAGERVALDEAVSSLVSARGCLGATEGWTMLGDERGGVAVINDLAQVAAVHLIHHEKAAPGAFTRMYLSLVESDETAASFWRGQSVVSVTLAGVRETADARRVARSVNLPLHVVPGRAAGVWVSGAGG